MRLLLGGRCEKLLNELRCLTLHFLHLKLRKLKSKLPIQRASSVIPAALPHRRRRCSPVGATGWGVVLTSKKGIRMSSQTQAPQCTKNFKKEVFPHHVIIIIVDP